MWPYALAQSPVFWAQNRVKLANFHQARLAYPLRCGMQDFGTADGSGDAEAYGDTDTYADGDTGAYDDGGDAGYEDATGGDVAVEDCAIDPGDGDGVTATEEYSIEQDTYVGADGSTAVVTDEQCSVTVDDGAGVDDAGADDEDFGGGGDDFGGGEDFSFDDGGGFDVGSAFDF